MSTYVLSKEESHRINILKYISIILVVYIHSYVEEVNFADGTDTLFLPWWLLSLENLVSKVIAKCAVPMFFLISSILLFKTQRSYKKTITGKIRSLLIPYLIWNSFWIIVFILLQSLSFTAPFFSGSNITIMQSSVTEWLELYGIGPSLPYPHAYPLWFMRDLMVITPCFPFIGKIASKFSKPLLICSVVLLLAPINFPLKQAILWFCLGACIVNLQIHITVLDSIAMWKISLFYILCASITLIAEHSITYNLFIFVSLGYWARLSKCIFDCKISRNIFINLSEWTFIIYVAHELTLSSLKKVCLRILPTEPIWLLIEYLAIPIIVIAGCSIVGVVFKKTAPNLYSILTGAR
ncbi:MAG: acyltransferase [Clostridiaceae bacterium]|nr:acyltransferase [Clostridiaceae bacterium]